MTHHYNITGHVCVAWYNLAISPIVGTSTKIFLFHSNLHIPQQNAESISVKHSNIHRKRYLLNIKKTSRQLFRSIISHNPNPI